MMPTAQGMIPNHVLRVGQTVRLDAGQETVPQCAGQAQPASSHCDDDLETSLDNLNQLILELDPTFEPIQVNKSPSPIGLATEDSDEDDSQFMLVPRGCPPSPLPTEVRILSPSIPIPALGGLSCSPHGTLVFSGSPSSSLPPLPCGSAPRRVPSGRQDTSTCTQGSLRLSHSNRNSATSLLSMSTCSDTSYILGSNLSLASEDPDPLESHRTRRSGSFSDGSRTGGDFDSHPSPDKSPPTKHLLGLPGKGAQSSPASLSGSLTDIPVVLVNGFPQQDVKINQFPSPEFELAQKPFSPQSYQARFSGSQPSMKFVMDSSKFWFRPHINRTEAEALISDKEAGTFVVRDSTSHRGSFGLAMKVDQSPTGFPASPGESSSDCIRHFLIESSAKGVRVRGSSQEPYFGSLSALVYQHTISAYALPCRLLLHTQELTGDEKANERQASSDNLSTASNFVYLNAVPTEMLTGPYAVQRAVSSTLEKPSGSFVPTIVNMKVSLKGVTLTDVNRKLFFRRHYPSHLLSYGGEDPDNRLWLKGSSFGARMFGFVAKGLEAGVENVCHVFAEYDPLQPCNNVVSVVQAAVAKV